MLMVFSGALEVLGQLLLCPGEFCGAHPCHLIAEARIYFTSFESGRRQNPTPGHCDFLVDQQNTPVPVCGLHF